MVLKTRIARTLRNLWCILNGGHHKEFVRSEGRLRCFCGWTSPGFFEDSRKTKLVRKRAIHTLRESR